jgi:hypothetical protein
MKYKSTWKPYEQLKDSTIASEYSDKPMRPGEGEKLEAFHYRDIADYRHRFVAIVWSNDNETLDAVAESIFTNVPETHSEFSLLLEAGSIRRKELNNC